MENSDFDLDEKIEDINEIFEDLISDAQEFSEDLVSGIHSTIIMGLISFVAGVQTLWYNRYYISGGDYIPLLLAGITCFSGLFIILRGYILRKKYSILIEARKNLSNIR
jgi:hypothetical protein